MKNLNIERVFNFFVYSVLFLVPLIFLPFLNLPFELPKLALFRSVTLILLFVYALKLAKDKHISIHDVFANRNLKRLILLILIFLACGVAFSIAPKLSFWGSYYRLQGVYTLLHYLLFFLLLCLNFRKSEQFEKGIKFMFLGFLVAFVFGFFERLGFDPFSLGLMENTLGRVSSSFGHPNYFAEYAILVVFPALALWSKNRKVSLLIIALGFATIVLTQSRAGLLAFFVGLWFYLIMATSFTKMKKYSIMLSLVPLAVLFTWAIINTAASSELVQGNPLLERLVVNEDNLRSIKSRELVWQSVPEMAQKNVLFGSGFETFYLVFQEVAPKEILEYEKMTFVTDKAHNFILEVMVENGVLGLLFLFFAGWVVFKIAQLALKAKQKDKKLLATGILSAMIAASVMNMFSFFVTSHYVVGVFLLAFLCFLASKKQLKKKVSVMQNKLLRRLVIIFTFVFVFLSLLFQNLGFLTADYYAAKGFSTQNYLLASSLQPNQSYYNFVLASIYENIGDLQRAHKFAEKGGNFSEYNDSFYYYLKAKIWQHSCRLEEKLDCGLAESAFERAIDLAPTFPPYQLSFAKFYLEREDCPRAVGWLESYLSLTPEFWKNSGTEEHRLFYKHNPDFDQVFQYFSTCGINVK